MTEFRTRRLWLRPFTPGDVPAYQAIRAQPGVTRYLPSHSDDPALAARRAADAVAAFMACWERDGYGPWAVEHRGRLAGHLGLRYLPEMGETEVLFLLDPGLQRQGLATEGTRAALHWGFRRLRLEQIVAYALPENGPSLAVLARAGMDRRPGLHEAFGLKVVRLLAQRTEWGQRNA
ncbi:MAG: GNAT family N-acetyltransferase [Pseudomonadota bacterium]